MTGVDHNELALRERYEAWRLARHQRNPVNPANWGLVVCGEGSAAERFDLVLAWLVMGGGI